MTGTLSSYGNLNCKRSQTNMPQNIGSTEDLVSKYKHRVDTLNSTKLFKLSEN